MSKRSWVWPVGVAVVSVLVLTGCGGSSESLSPLEATKKLAESGIACDDPRSETISATTGETRFGVAGIGSPVSTGIACDSMGGTLSLLVSGSVGEGDASLLSICQGLALDSLYEELSVSDTSSDALSGIEIAHGDGWIAYSEDSLVGARDLADSLGGEVASLDSTCEQYSERISEVVDKERAAIIQGTRLVNGERVPIGTGNAESSGRDCDAIEEDAVLNNTLGFLDEEFIEEAKAIGCEWAEGL